MALAKLKSSRHAVSRMKHRGVARTANGARQATINAYNIGLTFDEAEGSVKDYIGHLYAHNRANGNKSPKIRIYGEHVYIFSGRTLVTSYKIPDEVKEAAMEQYRRKKTTIVEARRAEDEARMNYASKMGYLGNVTIDKDFAY